MKLGRLSINSTGLERLENTTVSNFTTPFGIKLRRAISPLVRKIIVLSSGKKVIVEQYPKLNKGEPYIFCSTHYFTEDIQAGLGCLDRNAWGLIGTTDQLEHNVAMYGGWCNGIVYVRRYVDESRKEALKKMGYILNHGSSIWVCGEGGWNNSENLLVRDLFASPFLLNQSTGRKVVPMAIYNDEDNNLIYVRVGDPMDFSGMEKRPALDMLRDNMASMMFEMMFEHSETAVRAEMPGDIHLNHMEERRREYMKTPWTRDVWNEELTVYHGRSTEEQIARDREFLEYMHAHWNSPPDKETLNKGHRQYLNNKLGVRLGTNDCGEDEFTIYMQSGKKEKEKHKVNCKKK